GRSAWLLSNFQPAPPVAARDWSDRKKGSRGSSAHDVVAGQRSESGQPITAGDTPPHHSLPPVPWQPPAALTRPSTHNLKRPRELLAGMLLRWLPSQSAQP